MRALSVNLRIAAADPGFTDRRLRQRGRVAAQDLPPGEKLERWVLTILSLERDRYDAGPGLFNACLELAADHMDIVAAHTSNLSRALERILSDLVPPNALEETVAVVEDATVLFRVPMNIARFRPVRPTRGRKQSWPFCGGDRVTAPGSASRSLAPGMGFKCGNELTVVSKDALSKMVYDPRADAAPPDASVNWPHGAIVGRGAVKGYVIGMLFWIVAALLTLGASLAVLAPLARGRRSVATAADHDLEVYKDQLQELERDVGRGLINPTEAEQARAEIGRRILKLGERGNGGRSALASPTARMAGMAAVLAVPVVSWALYGYLGSPDLSSQPLQARLEADPAKSSIDELVARAEKHLAANPNDGKGWDVLAPVYLRMGRFADAVGAYHAAIRLEGSTAARESGLGEAMASAADGVISDEAEAAFNRALRLEPDYPKARFYLATAMAQDGKLQEAVAAWREMLVKLPADSPWRVPVEQAVAEADKRLAAGKAPSTTSEATTSGATTSTTPGPTQDDVEAAATMSDADRNAMIEAMVAGLDQKLRQNPRDLEGWQRLVRSYLVLGRKTDALDAMSRGVAALGEGSVEATALTQFAATLGLSGTE
ncbi:hypothetical protein MesoLjLc_59200 [Mesorhizobium sp. L-8-10]|nr:hypothetical protein MesoLjLc_59200 [Mesorhizobium sp. L-8-10]